MEVFIQLKDKIFLVWLKIEHQQTWSVIAVKLSKDLQVVKETVGWVKDVLSGTVVALHV